MSAKEDAPARAIFFDESGFTGKALLDPAQPLFCVASSLVGETESKEILRRAFPDYAGREFKFQSLWRREKTRSQLKAFSKEIYGIQDRVCLWVIDKKFCVLTKLIDFLVEPVLHDMGRDFYKDSHAPKFCNYIHHGFELVGSPELYDATLQPYYDFARDPTEARLRELQRRLILMANSGPSELRFFFELAAKGALEFHQHSDINTFKDTFEVQLTSVLAAVGYWRNRFPDDFEIYHDASSNFFKQAALWEAITSNDVPQQFHPVANAPPMEFPLRVRSTAAVDSKESAAIQLCDVIAGLAVKLARGSENADESSFLSEVISAGFGELSLNGIQPGSDFPDGPPALLDGPDSVDRFLAIIGPHLDSIRPSADDATS